MMAQKNFYNILLLLFVTLLTTSCKDNSTNPLDDIQIQNCGDISNVDISPIEALYWDIMNGVPRGDIPGGVPTINNPGGSYSHTENNPLGQPLLGFQYPAGYTPQTDPTQNAIGVNLFRNDGRAIWRRSQLALFNQVRARDVLAFEINTLIDFLGGSANNIQVICSHEGAPPIGQLAPGFSAEFANRLIRFDGFSALITAGVTFTPTGLTSVVIQKNAAPTDEHDFEIMNTFLPISYQLLFTGGGERDSDSDGVPDSRDQCPNTPPGTTVNSVGCPTD